MSKLIHTKPAHPQSVSGFRIPGFHKLQRRGVFPFRFLGAETPKLIHAKPIRGFVYQDSATCENEGSFPFVSQVPKCQNLFTLNRLIHRVRRGSYTEIS
jgi:hypothetical protein